LSAVVRRSLQNSKFKGQDVIAYFAQSVPKQTSNKDKEVVSTLGKELSEYMRKSNRINSEEQNRLAYKISKDGQIESYFLIHFAPFKLSSLPFFKKYNTPPKDLSVDQPKGIDLYCFCTLSRRCGFSFCRLNSTDTDLNDRRPSCVEYVAGRLRKRCPHFSLVHD
jgi:hypothetical protein